MLASLYLSFTEYSLLSPPEWIGGKNYVDMVSDTRLQKSLVRHLHLRARLGAAPTRCRAGPGTRLDTWHAGALDLPVGLLPPIAWRGSIAIAILWRQIFGSDGLVNQFLALFGIDGPGWISDPGTALGSLVLLNVWTFGAPMVIFLAGPAPDPSRCTTRRPPIDGASPLAKLPIHHVAAAVPDHLLQPGAAGDRRRSRPSPRRSCVCGGSGGPADSTLFYTLYLYQQGFGQLEHGLRLGDGVAPARHRRCADRGQLPRVPVLGVPRGLIRARAANWSSTSC